MLVADPGLYKAGVIKPVEALLKAAPGVEYTLFTNVRPNPEAVTIEDEAIPQAHQFKVDALIAVGAAVLWIPPRASQLSAKRIMG